MLTTVSMKAPFYCKGSTEDSLMKKLGFWVQYVEDIKHHFKQTKA